MKCRIGMKKVLLSILLTAFALLSIPSCNMSGTLLQVAVEKADESCPNDIGDGLTLTGLKYDGQNVIYSFECDAEEYYLEQDLVTPELKQATIDELLTKEKADENLQAFLSLVRKAKAGIIYHYYTSTPGMEMDVTLEPGDF